MDDLISRQEAITAIQEAYADTEGGADKCAVWKNVGLTNALHIMQDLPSVQPYTEAEIQKMQELEQAELQKAYECGRASAQPEQDCILKQFGNCSYSETGCSDCAIKVKIRKALPSAQPEIIHCKDCKHFEYDHPYVIQGVPVLGHEVCSAWGGGCKTDENGYCFLAERRTDGNGRD